VGTEDNYEANPDPFLLSNSLITKGMGKAVVLAVGKMSQRGIIESQL